MRSLVIRRSTCYFVGDTEQKRQRLFLSYAWKDERYGKECSGNGLPEELQRRETRLKRIREAKRALEERAREKAKKEGKPVEKARPEAKDQYNFTDPESRIMKSSSDGFVQAECQAITLQAAPRG